MTHRRLRIGLAGLSALAALLAAHPSWAEQAPAAPPPPETCSDAKDCLNKGARAHQQKDFARAARFLPTACEIEVKACNIAGEIFRNGDGGVPKDGQKSADLHGKACDKGMIVSCAIEAQLRYQGSDGAKVDKARARLAYERSCGPDFYDSCANAGVMCATGDGGPADPAKARGLYQKACDGGEAAACVNLASMLLNGEGGDADKSKAQAMFAQQCEKKQALGCYNLGLVFAKALNGPQDLGQAITHLQKACDLGNPGGCQTAQQIRDDMAKQIKAQTEAASGKGKAKGKK